MGKPRSPERKQLFFDLFVTALEGGIGYWSQAHEYHWEKDDGTEDLDGFYAVIIDTEQEDDVMRIDADVIAKGFSKIAAAKPPYYDPNGARTQCADVKYLSKGLAAAVREASFDPTEADFDAGDADVIVQVGLFGGGGVRMKLGDAQALAEAAMEQWLDEEDGWKFGWMNGKRQFGYCRYNVGVGHRIREIRLSRTLTQLNDEDAVLDVILHEVAHALTMGHGHDRVWKAMCRRVGANPERCYEGGEGGVVTPPRRYVGECGFGCEIKRDRLAKRLKYGAVECKAHSARITWTDYETGRKY